MMKHDANQIKCAIFMCHCQKKEEKNRGFFFIVVVVYIAVVMLVSIGFYSSECN